jgi:predicted dienelactone hydrolase
MIWYPADGDAAVEPQGFGPPGQPIFQAAPAAPNAPLAAGAVKFPLIMLSHGTGGTVQSMAWFATALATRSYIVAGVNHPGNTAMAPYTVQGFTLWWLRAKDISVALDDLLADDEFGPRIDPQRTGAAGCSLGGYTVIELAGGITSRAKFDDVCRASAEQTSCKAPPEFFRPGAQSANAGRNRSGLRAGAARRWRIVSRRADAHDLCHGASARCCRHR